MHSDGVECVAELRFPVGLVRMAGTLDLLAAAAVRQFLLTCLADEPVALVVDLAGLSVTDELALALLPATGRQADAWPGVQLLLCGADPAVAAAIERVDFAHDVRVFPGRRDALAVAAGVPAPRRLHRHLAAALDAPRRARELIDLAGHAWGVPPEPTQVAQVIATELVTNAVLHARTSLDFTLLLRNRQLRLAVRDGDPSPPRHQPVVSERADHGRGLRVVDVLSVAWGCLPATGGKVVWATVAV